jgi:hypothetical protein
MVGRRLVILVAVLMGLTALAASVAPPPQPTPRGASTPTASPTPAPAPAPAGGTRQVAAKLDVARGHDRVTVRQGDLLSLQVASDAVGSVAIEGLGEVEAVDPASPARFSIAADRPGRYPVELVEQQRPLGVLVVNR